MITEGRIWKKKRNGSVIRLKVIRLEAQVVTLVLSFRFIPQTLCFSFDFG